MAPYRDIAAFCEEHPHDARRAPSTVCLGDSRAKADCNAVELIVALATAAMREVGAL